MRLLAPAEPAATPVINTEDMIPIKPQFTPWRVRQQMMESEDRRTAALLKDRQKEMRASESLDKKRPVDSVNTAQSVDELEKEMGIGQE